MCDGAISNVSEALMKDYNVGQDEYIFRLYSIATVAIAIAAALKGDLVKGLDFVSKPGTLEEIEKGQVPTYQPITKLFILITFASTGFFGSSCAAAITKEFGALTMSITSTARKATTLFFSFAFFPNECTWEHICGIVIFISSLIVKSLKKKKKKGMKEINKSSSNCDRAGKMRRWMRFLRKEDQFKKRDSDPFLVLPLAGIRTNGQQIHHTQQRQQVLSNVI